MQATYNSYVGILNHTRKAKGTAKFTRMNVSSETIRLQLFTMHLLREVVGKEEKKKQLL